jgi:hypothetical protein
MVKKFEEEGGHNMGNRKVHKISPIHQHNIDEDINLQKVGGGLSLRCMNWSKPWKK